MIYKKSKVETPQLDIFIDNSKSVGANIKQMNYNINDYFKYLEEWSFNNKIKINYFLFGEKVRKIPNYTSITFEDELSNYSQVFTFLEKINTNNDIIIIGDGLNNYGNSTFNYNFNNFIHTIGVGYKYNDINDIDLKFNKFNFYNNDSLGVVVDIKIKSKSNYQSFISLNNNKNKDFIIDTLNIFKGSTDYTDEIMIPVQLLLDKNTIYANGLNDEYNLQNNTIKIDLPKSFTQDKKALLISGALSTNTSVIKDAIIDNMNEYRFDHLYRIYDDRWNNNIYKKNNYNEYDLLLFDNFPIIEDDIIVLNKIINTFNNKIIYFLGPNNKNKNIDLFFDFCNCDITINKGIYNNQKSVNINNFDFVIPSNRSKYFITCDDNSIKYKNNNCLLTENEDVLFFFMEDIYNINQLSMYNHDYSFVDLINFKINDFLYKENYLIDIYVNNDTFFDNENFDVFLKVNNNDIIDNFYIIIENIEFNTSKHIFNKSIVDTNFYKFTESLAIPGRYNIKGVVPIKEENIYTNNITIDILDKRSEEENIYLLDEQLKAMSYTTNGNYSNLSNAKELINDIKIKNIVNNEVYKKNIFSYPFIWLIIILILSLEWYIRNKIGLL